MTRIPKQSVVALATLGLFSLSLAACGGGDTGGTTTPSPDTTTTDTAGSGDSGDVVTISYMHRLPDGEGMTTVADIIAEWNAANPNIQVESTKFDGAATEMILKLETDIKAGAGVCLAQIGYSEVPQMYVKGLVQDVAGEVEKYADNFSAGALSMMSVGDASVGLPQDTGPLVYFYNEAEFAELGIEVPTTLAEFETAAATSAASEKYIGIFTPDEALYWLSAQSAAAGDTWFGSADGKWQVTADGPGSQTVATFWQGLIDTDAVPIEQRWGDGFTQLLNDGKLIGHIGAAWEAGFLLDSLDGTPAEGQWRVAQLPDFGAGAMTGPDGGSGVAVMTGCEHPAEAMEFNNWFNTQVEGLASQGLVVAANGAVETPEKMLRQFGGQDVMAELSQATADLNPNFPYAPGFASLSAVNETADKISTGGATVADVFTAAQNGAIAALKDLGLPVAE